MPDYRIRLRRGYLVGFKFELKSAHVGFKFPWTIRFECKNLMPLITSIIQTHTSLFEIVSSASLASSILLLRSRFLFHRRRKTKNNHQTVIIKMKNELVNEQSNILIVPHNIALWCKPRLWLCSRSSWNIEQCFYARFPTKNTTLRVHSRLDCCAKLLPLCFISKINKYTLIQITNHFIVF